MQHEAAADDGNAADRPATRLWDDLMALAAITDPERPYTRRSFSPLFLEGRDWLRRRFEEAGLTVRHRCRAPI